MEDDIDLAEMMESIAQDMDIKQPVFIVSPAGPRTNIIFVHFCQDRTAKQLDSLRTARQSNRQCREKQIDPESHGILFI